MCDVVVIGFRTVVENIGKKYLLGSVVRFASCLSPGDSEVRSETWGYFQTCLVGKVCLIFASGEADEPAKVDK